MQETSETSTVRILGESFRIRGGDPEEVEALARFLEERLGEIRSRNESLPLRNLLILTSLNLAQDLFRERREREEFQRFVEERTRLLRERLDAECGPGGEALPGGAVPAAGASERRSVSGGPCPAGEDAERS